MSQLLWSLALLPAVVGASLLLAGRRAERTAGAVGALTGLVVLALSVVASWTRPSVRLPFVAGGDLALAVDGLAAVVLPAVTAVAAGVLVCSLSQVRTDRVRFFGFVLLFEAAVVLTVTATTLLTLLLAWEAMGAMSYALIALSWRQTSRVDGGRTSFLVTRAADLGLYIAAGAALAGTGSFELATLAQASGHWVDVAAAGLVVAALGKAAQLPFSFWLSRAMVGPSQVSALLHSAAMVAMGGYLLLRVEPLLAATGWAGPVVAWIGVTTAVVMGLVAVAQSDLKQLLAASTSAQLGFVVLAAGSGAVAAGTAHLVAHAAVKSLLFLVAGIWLDRLGTKDLRELAGAARATPVAGGCFAVGALALAGLPPLSLWVTKDQILAGASPALALTGLLAAALSAVYAGKALLLVLAPARRPRPVVALPWLEQVPLVLLAVAAAGLGALGLPPVAQALHRAVGEPVLAAPGPVGLVVSALLAAGGLLLARRRPLRPLALPASAARWFDLELAARTVVVRPTQQLAERLARFDDRVLAGGIDRLGRTTATLARRSSRFDDRVLAGGIDRLGRTTGSLAQRSSRFDLGGFDAAVRSVGAGTRWLGRLARRPQTGQVHTYYAQAAALLAAALLLVLLVR